MEPLSEPSIWMVALLIACVPLSFVAAPLAIEAMGRLLRRHDARYPSRRARRG
ncbi:MAG TPA: hypothetical protein VNO26_02925 [Candidatus Limnocylindria bacterium]|nr:hypothetical protein [Candidatus Limnocylindria bacterium]